MFLKSLILRGFKTFAEATEIEFSAGARVTAIVGPNGCGKSNLLDATRWVLGEDNPRHLRVAALADIIHAGTSARKPLSLAEVTMVFDNAAGRLALPFSEIAIKRRTFREGESEFFINKNPCRLKDIKDLLLDTGLGEGTYSIITQGQVDAILSSKGEERRAVFEEAAGINKYKTRKLAAEKKLISAEQNILRISDLKIEVGEHLINLEEQAKRAREYLDIQARVKELDLGLSKRNLSLILEKRTKLQAELVQARAMAAAKKAAEEQDFAKLQQLKEAYRRLETEIDETIIKAEAEKDGLRDLELDRRFLESELVREQKILAEIADKDARLQAKIAEIKQLLDQGRPTAAIDGGFLKELVDQLLQQTGQLVEQLAALLAGLGRDQTFSLSFGQSTEQAEVHRLKLEMLGEEVITLTAAKTQAAFARQAHQSQLDDLTDRTRSAKDGQQAPQLLSRKKTAKEELARTITQLEEKLRSEDREERQVFGAETTLEISLAKLEGELSGLQEKLALEYNLSLDELQAQNYEVSNAAKAKSAVDSGRLRLRQLEPVNLLAIEEFDKAKERLNFIEAQLADLNSARDNLRTLIGELDLKAEQTFVETMQQVSAVFSETFSKLFLGGEAKIALTPGVPALDAEIEISVRPSGRKWLPLPLLSGGERSLSAIAILFSLLKIRPSPFCFLDEVDAALDDANIGRFNEMVRDFSAQSQIIIITHNKRTMSVADTIYGVTMEEPGISKIISMKLAEVAVA